MRKSLLLISALFFTTIVYSQDGVTTFGITVKPVFPSEYFRTGPKVSFDNDIQFTLTQNSGFSAGGTIRYGINKTLSIESGLSFVKRIYQLDIADSSAVISTDFKVIGYEIPLQALVFIQLSKHIWMNVALGPELSIFPSDIRTTGDHFVQETARQSQKNILKGGMLANIGWEWRTPKSGYIYLGSSYHRSFSDVYTNYAGYLKTPRAKDVYAYSSTPLAGDYIAIDIRYYFHENPRPKKVKK